MFSEILKIEYLRVILTPLVVLMLIYDNIVKINQNT